MKIVKIVIWLIVIASFIVGASLCARLPEQIPSHWNAVGEVNGHMSKFWGTFFEPLLFVGLALLFEYLPRLDPRRKNVEGFQKQFHAFIIVLFLFLFWIYIQTLLWALGTEINPVSTMPLGFGALMITAGVLIKNAKPNWFIGIRTPWTLSSDMVWEKTHKLGAKLFFAVGIINFIGFFFPRWAIWFVMGPVITAAVWSVVYSYVVYRHEKHK